MEIKDLKNEIIKDYKNIEIILESIGCKYIKHNKAPYGDDYFSASNADGDNRGAINVYINDNITTVNHTRASGGGDLISLVMYSKDLNFHEAVTFICDTLGIKNNSNFRRPKSYDIIKKLSRGDEEKNKIKRLDELPLKYLNRFKYVAHKKFTDDSISVKTQYEFGIHYDIFYDSIIIPIMDEESRLVGVKARRVNPSEFESKYIYVENLERTQILYGLNMTYKHIVVKNRVYVFESEKSVMQLWTHGIKNSVAVGSKSISMIQARKLINMRSEIVLCYDEDVVIDNDLLNKIDSLFPRYVRVGIMVDKDGILSKKESPSDNIEKFRILQENIVWRY